MKPNPPADAKRSSVPSPTVAASAIAGVFPIVAVGASAGGFDAFVELLGALPPKIGMGFVLVQHLDPGHPSLLSVLLARATSMPVCEAREGLEIERDRVYVIPPNCTLMVEGRVLKVRSRGQRGSLRSIDAFFESLAANAREHAIGIVLSGQASDGAAGLEAIKAEGGITFAQDETAKHDSMPRHAIEAGCVDFVLAPAAIARELGRIAQHPFLRGRVAEAVTDANGATGKGAPDVQSGAKPPKGPTPLTEIIGALRAHTKVDFAFYKPNTVTRRIARRMVLRGQESMAAYARGLAGNTRELDLLYAELLIGVTSFFRNPEAFETLKRVVFPTIVPPRQDNVVRAWTLGCSTGQEAYSIAMAYLEYCDGRNGPAPKLQVFATDLAAGSLERARRGFYTNAAVEVSPERLKRFFVEEQGGYRVNNTLREMCTFSHHDVMGDPPFSRMDLISCRNLMIYLEPEMQKQILPSFHYALREGGFLFLGASETVGEFVDLFAPVDKKHRFYRKNPVRTPPLKLRFAPRHPALRPDGSRGIAPTPVNAELEAQREADRLTLGRFAPAGVLVDAAWHILQFRGATGRFLEPVTGRASYHLLKMARDGLLLPLRNALKRAKATLEPVRCENVTIGGAENLERITVEVIPLKNLREQFFLVWFEPQTTVARTPSRVRASPAAKARRGSDELSRELAETREYLHALQEQHDAAMQEVQVSHEEVQSANEELQSINEELETSKEELVSSFEELTTLNEETVHRNAELNRVNAELKRAQQLAAEHTTVLEQAVAARTAELRDSVGELEALSYGVVHDMRAPLRAMRGYADLIMSSHAAALDADALGYLEKIAHSAHRLDSLIEHVITYTRVLRTQLQRAPLAVEPMLRQLIEDFPELRAQREAIRISGPLPKVLAHEATLAQCLAHLLGNALKFAKPGVPPRVEVSAESREGEVRLWIADNGIGIDPRDHARIFNLFERVGTGEAGVGIGLAIVQKSIERSGGRVGVESALGQGSRFWIQLPAADSLL